MLDGKVSFHCQNATRDLHRGDFEHQYTNDLTWFGRPAVYSPEFLPDYRIRAAVPAIPSR
jgi:hypothetical protein